MERKPNHKRESKRKLQQGAIHLGKNIVESLHGIPKAKAQILKAKADSLKICNMKELLDVLDRLKFTPIQQRKIIVKLMSSHERRRKAKKNKIQEVL